MVSLEARQNVDTGAPLLAVADVNKAIQDISPLTGTDEQIKGAGFNPNIVVDKLTLTSHAPIPDSVPIDVQKYERTRNDQQIQQMQNERDRLLATQQKKEAEATAELEEIAKTPDSDAGKKELTVQADKLKHESDQAAHDASEMDNQIQKRAHLLINTDVEQAQPAPGDQQTPTAAPKTGP